MLLIQSGGKEGHIISKKLNELVQCIEIFAMIVIIIKKSLQLK